jgi:hypothetical protein
VTDGRNNLAIEKNRTLWTPEYVALLDKQENGKLNRAEEVRLGEIAKYFGEAEKLRIGVAKEAPSKAATPIIAPSPAAQQLAECARNQVGVAEQPPESNRGPQIDEYIRSVGLDPDHQSVPDWSGAFISWCLKKAAPSLKLSPNVFELWLSAQQKGLAIPAADIRQTSDIRIGDIYVMGRTVGGAGIVVDVTERPKFVGVEGMHMYDSVKLMRRELGTLPFFRGIIRLTDEGADQGVATTTDQPPRGASRISPPVGKPHDRQRESIVIEVVFG